MNPFYSFSICFYTIDNHYCPDAVGLGFVHMNKRREMNVFRTVMVVQIIIAVRY